METGINGGNKKGNGTLFDREKARRELISEMTKVPRMKHNTVDIYKS